MTFTTIDKANVVSEEGKQYQYFWSFREAGRRERLNDGACETLGLPGKNWLLSEARWIPKNGNEPTRWWIVCRRDDDLAYGVTHEDLAVVAAISRADDRTMDIALASLPS